MLTRFGLAAQAMPALLLLGLMQATTPALARGLVPVCTAAGTSWRPMDGEGEGQRDPAANACPHGWCTPRKPRADRS